MKKNGFTLIELLVVMFILSLLFALVMPNFTGARQRAEDAKTKSNMFSLKNSLRQYYNDKGAYPTGTDITKTLDLGQAFFDSYMLGSGVGATYIWVDSDRFRLKTIVSSGDPAELGTSQKNCGVGVTEAMTFMVCAN